jgi:hypothetical protein
MKSKVSHRNQDTSKSHLTSADCGSLDSSADSRRNKINNLVCTFKSPRNRTAMRQTQAGDIVLLFQEESEALTHPYLTHAWVKRGADLRVEAPGWARKVAMIGALDVAAGTLIVETSGSKQRFLAHQTFRELDAVDQAIRAAMT